ncbi:hypothetical protein OJF2_30580 [Aquisphaera giovannonii]|uniref:Uncharacterized protein n=1 Tax=Aquisphaera giovannonii TaxID=406548 RepID=A0A5B9W1W5_9BACT|nr:hypothetical protein [Aquisphaera giovannonii]QEH34518.1 hypothetical protein OJF2_30580 [Aquisphaera giovannonii]
MQNAETPSPSPASRHPLANGEAGGGADATPAAPAARPSGRAWLLVVAAGLLAGPAGFGCGEYAARVFAPSLELPPGIRGDRDKAPAEHARRLLESEFRTAIASNGTFGALLGLALGGAGGLARRSARAALWAGLIGLVLGGAAGAMGASLLVPLYNALHAPPSPDNATEEFFLAMATHGGMWAAVGGAAGLALGLGLGGRRAAPSLIGGLLGALVAATLYELCGPVPFPQERTLQPLGPRPELRLFACLATALLSSAGALWASEHLSLRRPTRPILS